LEILVLNMNKIKKRIFSFALISLFFFSAIFLYKPIVAISLNSPAATICVDPPTSKAGVGQTFTININVSDVIDLYGWEFKLGWNLTLLDAVSVTEGSFLKSGGNTFFVYKIFNTEGYILVDCTLLGNTSGVSGDGILATVEFDVECRGETILDLYDTKLVNSFEQLIFHEVIDGTIRVMNAHFTLITLYVVNIYVNETFDQGSSLKVRFHSYSGGYQGEVNVWNGTPELVQVSKNVPHPLGLPVEKATLVLTDEFGTILQTVTSFVVRRSHLMTRLTELDANWLYVSSSERPAIMMEIIDIDGQWFYAPK